MMPALLAASLLTLPPNTKLLQYGVDQFIVQCAPAQTCTIMLLSDSSIDDITATNNSKANPQTGWMIRPGESGGYPMLYLSPLGLGMPSNMIVTTPEKHRYTITLQAVPRAEVTDYAIAAPDNHGEIHIEAAPAPKLIVETPAPTPTPEDLPAPSSAPPRMEGDQSLAPARAVRTASTLDLTYRVPNGSSPPSIARELADGTLASINYTPIVTIVPHGEIVTYRVFDLERPIVVFTGSGKILRRLRIFP